MRGDSFCVEAVRATFAQIPLSSVNEEGGFFDGNSEWNERRRQGRVVSC